MIDNAAVGGGDFGADKLIDAFAVFISIVGPDAFSDKDAEICAEPLKKCLDMISKAASDIRRAPTTIEIKVKAARTKRKKSIKEKAMSEPLVKEALELFEGRVVDVREVKDN